MGACHCQCQTASEREPVEDCAKVATGEVLALEPQPILLGGPSAGDGKPQPGPGPGAGGAEEEQAEAERPLVQFARRTSQMDCSKPRLLLVSDNLPLFELLIRATKESTVVVPVQYDAWSLQELVAAVRLRAGRPCHQFASVGLLDHGAPDAFCLLKSVGDGWVDLEKIKASPDLQDCFRQLASYVEAAQDPTKFREYLPARVDLMNCSVYAGAGRELLDYLEELTQTNWAASTNDTGYGCDWILESDEGLGDVAASYFCEQELKRWKFAAKTETSTHADLLEKHPQAKSKAYIEGSKPSKGSKHIVLSTRYKEPWFGLSVKAKLALLEEGFTVYNPNTDNAEAYGMKANDRWLGTFMENLDHVRKTKGFVLQLQQGLKGTKSDMMVSEEEISELKKLVRLSVWAHNEADGGFNDRKEWPRMVKRAGFLFNKMDLYETPGPKHLGVQNVETDDAEGFYEGAFDKNGESKGEGTFRWLSGQVYAGQWHKSKQHGKGTHTFGDGSFYTGEFQKGKYHGQGENHYKNGDVYKGEWQDDKEHGSGILRKADGKILKQGEWHMGEFQKK